MNSQDTSQKIDIKPQVCYFAVDKSENYNKIYGINQLDRRKHLYILGKTGMGKTTLLENMILQDIYNGYGVCFIDPHGDSSQYLLEHIPKHRQSDVVVIDPSDTEFPVGFNILESQNGEKPFLIASGLMSVFNRIWSGLWSARMEYILNNTLLALLQTPENTILGVIQMLTDDNFREKIVNQVTDPLIKNFWLKEFATFNTRYRQEAVSPILNKIGQFLASEPIRNILGQKKSTINLRQIMDEKKILIVNLSKGKLGDDNSNLFGSLLVAKLQIAAMSRVDLAEKKREDFFLYVDEFQNFTTDSFATILSEARKYRLNLVLAHQYIGQLSETGNSRVKNAIFGNVGTIITFKLGFSDAQEISKEFSGQIKPETFLDLSRTKIAFKIGSDEEITKPQLAFTLPPIFEKLTYNSEIILNRSRQKYSKNNLKVNEEINEQLEFLDPQENREKKSLKQNNNRKQQKIDDKKNLLEEKSKQRKPEQSKVYKPISKKTTAENMTTNNSENILELRSPKKTTSSLSAAQKLAFTKKALTNFHIKSEKTKTFDHTKELGDYFEIPS